MEITVKHLYALTGRVLTAARESVVKEKLFTFALGTVMLEYSVSVCVCEHERKSETTGVSPRYAQAT